MANDDCKSNSDTLATPPEHIAALLTDAHCHPTDDPRPWRDVSVLTDKLRQADDVGRVCAMATSVHDQQYVSHLATHLKDKVIPAFGYHPWFVHTIAVHQDSTPEQHYRSVLHSGNSYVGDDDASSDFEALVAELPAPVPLGTILATLRANLQAHPNALLGEVGIDRVFRLPRDPKGWTHEPHNAEGDDEQPKHSHSLGLRQRRLTNVTPAIEHQLHVVKAQIALAVELRRSVSFHSVRAGGALATLLDDLRATYPGKDDGLNRREKKRREKERKHSRVSDDDHDEDREQQAAFSAINVDLHSCTLSPDLIAQLQRRHANVWVSFSMAINARQKDLAAQLRASDPHRLLIESDWHSADGLGVRCWAMLRLATDTIGVPLAPAEETEDAQRYEHAARFMHENWLRFHHHKELKDG